MPRRQREGGIVCCIREAEALEALALLITLREEFAPEGVCATSTSELVMVHNQEKCF